MEQLENANYRYAVRRVGDPFSPPYDAPLAKGEHRGRNDDYVGEISGVVTERGGWLCNVPEGFE